MVVEPPKYFIIADQKTGGQDLFLAFFAFLGVLPGAGSLSSTGQSRR